MADNQYGLEAQWQLNRLAGTLDANKRPLYDIDTAANIWAGTTELPVVAALNYKAGLTGFDRLDFVGVCNVLAGTTGLGALKALALIPDALGVLGQDAVWWIDARDHQNSGAPLKVVRNLGTGGSVLDCRTGSTSVPDTNDPLFLPAEQRAYVYLPGVNTNNFTIPQSTGTYVGDVMDWRFDVTSDNWNAGSAFYLAALAGAISTTGTSWAILMPSGGGTGYLRLNIADGTTLLQAQSSVKVPANPGDRIRIRITYTRNTGAGQYAVTFYTNTADFSTPLEALSSWDQLGVVRTGASIGAMLDYGSTPCWGDMRATGSAAFAGNLYGATLSVDGSVVVNISTSVLTTGSATSFTATTGQTVTINRSTSGRKTVVVPAAVVKSVDQKHVYLPGVNNNVLLTGGSNLYSAFTDIDIRARIALDSATANVFVVNTIAGSPNGGYRLNIASRQVYLYWSPSSGTLLSAVSSVGLSISDGLPFWVRATLDADNGSGGYTVTFYTSNDGDVWTQLGSAVTVGSTTSIAATNTGALYIGSGNAGTGSLLTGKVYRVQVLRGIDGTLALDVDAKDAPLNFTAGTANSFKAKTGQTVTMNSTAASGMRVVDALSASGSSCWLFGTDDYMEVNNRWVDGSTKCVYLPGVSGNYMSVPDSAALDVTGDIDIRVQFAPDAWKPSASARIISKSGNAPNIGWGFRTQTNGYFYFTWSADGTNINEVSVPGPTIADGAVKWVRVTHDVDNGAGGNDVKFYTSDDGTTWTQLGTTQTTAGTTSHKNTTAPVEVGSINGGLAPIAGRFYCAQVFNGIDGTKVLDVNTSVVTSVSQTTFTEQSTNAATVTINKSGTGYVSTPIVQSGYVFPTGAANLTPSTYSLLDFGASDSFSVVAVVRQWGTPTNFGYYISKRATAGYVLTSSGTALTLYGELNDGSAQQTKATQAITAGGTTTLGLNIDRSAQTLATFINGTLSTTSSTSSVGSPTNLNTLRIGRNPAGTAYQDFEFVAAAVFRRALTNAELKAVYEYYARKVA